MTPSWVSSLETSGFSPPVRQPPAAKAGEGRAREAEVEGGGSARGPPLSAAKAGEGRAREVEVDCGGGCRRRAGLRAAAERRGGIVKVNSDYSMFRFPPCSLFYTRSWTSQSSRP